MFIMSILNNGPAVVRGGFSILYYSFPKSFTVVKNIFLSINVVKNI